MKAVLSAVLLLLIGTAAWAHSWYPPQCCSSIDCEPVNADVLTETRNGWHVSVCSAIRPGVCIDGFVKRGQEKPSLDGGYHVCFNETRVICLFVPNNT